MDERGLSYRSTFDDVITRTAEMNLGALQRYPTHGHDMVAARVRAGGLKIDGEKRHVCHGGVFRGLVNDQFLGKEHG
ncbi:hypothetical protein [Corynebacterium camporealensis]|uniref:hypothetical protein n=1 Tax=Corynebacterium camporealensis TaxID=161896 RepID=UPI002013828B|nr:hypothetical protein [Corynebacterium camporealensis]